VINFVDLGIMRSVFFTSNDNADLDSDGVMNFMDLGIMKSKFFGAPGSSGLVDITATSNSQTLVSQGVDNAFDAHLK